MQSLNYIIGSLIVANIGTIITIIIMGLKVTWQLSQKLKELEMTDQNINTKADLAHKRIDKLKNILKEQEIHV